MVGTIAILENTLDITLLTILYPKTAKVLPKTRLFGVYRVLGQCEKEARALLGSELACARSHGRS